MDIRSHSQSESTFSSNFIQPTKTSIFNKALQVLKFKRFQLLLRYIQLHAPVKAYTLLRLIYQVLKYAPIKTEMFDILRIHFKNQNFRRISQSNKEIFSEAAFQSILARYLV